MWSVENPIIEKKGRLTTGAIQSQNIIKAKRAEVPHEIQESETEKQKKTKNSPLSWVKTVWFVLFTILP